MKLEAWQDPDKRAPWKVVRTDDYTDVPGEVVSADEATGECNLCVGGVTKAMSFGPGGIRIVARRR